MTLIHGSASWHTWMVQAVMLTSVVTLIPQCERVSNPLATYAETGMASCYPNEYHGTRTNSGEPYNRHAYTAAHATLPMGTWVIVRNLSTGREIKVRINDRFHRQGSSILRLSSKAALNLGITGDSGTVELFVTRPTPSLQASNSP